jgi:hypothetical protein
MVTEYRPQSTAPVLSRNALKRTAGCASRVKMARALSCRCRLTPILTAAPPTRFPLKPYFHPACPPAPARPLQRSPKPLPKRRGSATATRAQRIAAYSSKAEPSRAEPSRAEPSRAEPSRAEPSRAEPSWCAHQSTACLGVGRSVPRGGHECVLRRICACVTRVRASAHRLACVSSGLRVKGVILVPGGRMCSAAPGRA